MYNRIVTDNPGHVVTTSWGACEAGVSAATQQADDNIFANANAIGQSWFAASGDNGSRDCRGTAHGRPPGELAARDRRGRHDADVQRRHDSRESGLRGLWLRDGLERIGRRSEPALRSPVVPDRLRRAGRDEATRARRRARGGHLARELRLPERRLVHRRRHVGRGAAVGGILAAANAEVWRGGSGTPARSSTAVRHAAFHDVTTGSNGDYAAGPGYDMVTGLGSINAANFFLSPYVPSLSRASLALLLGLLAAVGAASAAGRSYGARLRSAPPGG